MKRLKLLFSLLLLSTALQAQSVMDSNSVSPSSFDVLTIERIKTLDELIALASTNSPLINAFVRTQDVRKQEMEITRKKWLQHISFTAGVGYGNGINANQLSATGINDQQLTYITNQSAFYNVGLNIRLPFSEVSSRRNEMMINKLEIERVEHLKENEVNNITDLVIQHYSNLKYGLKTIELKAEVVETNNVALDIAESYFKAGKLPVEEYRMAVDQSYSAKLELEKAKNDVWFAFRSLQELVGKSILR